MPRQGALTQAEQTFHLAVAKDETDVRRGGRV